MPENSDHQFHLPESDSAHPKSAEFVTSILERMTEMTEHSDHQLNILIGLSTAVFVFSAAGFEQSPNNIPLLIMAVFSAASSLVGLLAVHPPRGMRKTGQPESLMYNKKIASYPSADEYAKDLKQTAVEPEKILAEYAREIYNLAKYYYRPKRRLFQLSRRILFLGVTFALVSFLLNLIFDYLPR